MRSDEIRQAVLESLFWSPASPASEVAAKFGISRQAVQLHLQKLTRAKLIHAKGKVRWRQYQLAPIVEYHQRFRLKPGFSEYSVSNEIRSRIELGPDEQELIFYGVTEMVNNVMDHSGAKSLRIDVEKTAASASISIIDSGVGIFNKIATALKLADPREGILDLIKGKFTTDPKRHTGEGIFFTSRAFDRFSIASSKLLFVRTSLDDDWTLKEQRKPIKGTSLKMDLLLPAKRKLVDVFTPYSSGPEDYRFAKTRVPVKLATLIEESLLSRSSAKRLLARIDRFDEVVLDFAGIKSIGQAFGDEIFRVFALEHPQVRLIPVNANEQVTSMIRRAQSAR